MKTRNATADDAIIFDNWRKTDRMEEMTCRPVKDGKRVSPFEEMKRLAFFLEEYGEPVGNFSYFDYNPRNHSCEFGYTLNPKYRGLGLAERMIGFCISHAFSDSDWNLNKLYCQTAEFNIPSVKTLEKLGLKRDGVLRQHHELDGKMWDDFVYSILKSEWGGGVMDEKILGKVKMHAD